MHPILRNILAILAGIIGGSIVNMSIIMLSSSMIPPPEGADITTMEGLKETMHLFAPRYFIMPFLAHAMGTLAGAFLAALIATSHKRKFALAIGFFFLIGGIISVVTISPPAWFAVLDLTIAYLPMAWLGWKIALKMINKSHRAVTN